MRLQSNAINSTPERQQTRDIAQSDRLKSAVGPISNEKTSATAGVTDISIDHCIIHLYTYLCTK